MKIVKILESTRPIRSDIRNAYIDFSKMTLSLVAVVTDVIRDGRPVIGYGFNSNGRYGQGGLIRERFMPSPRWRPIRHRSSTTPARTSIRTGSGPRMMTNEKPGGHGERSVAVGTIDMAVWDAVAKIAGKPLLPAARRALRRRHAESARVRLRGGRLLLSRQGPRRPAQRDGELPRARLHRREDEDRRRKPRRGLRAHRSGAEDPRSGPAARRRRQRPLRSRHRDRLCARAVAVPAVLVRGGRRSAGLRAAGEARRASTPARWRPARTCSRCRTRAT